MGLSKLHDKCEKCKYKKQCGNKRMIACAVAQMPPQGIQNIGATITVPAARLILSDKSIQKQIADQLENNIYKQLRENSKMR